VTFAPSGAILSSYNSSNGDFSPTTLSPDRPRTVCMSALDPTTHNATDPYGSDPVRAGISVSVGLTSANTSVGTIVNTPHSIAGGQGCTYVTSPDLAFHPVGAGTSRLTVVGPSGYTTPSNYQSIAATVN
jgi:hypothetical protein